MPALKLFVTGTDTNIGKTYVSTGLLRKFNQAGYSTLGIKPLASGGYGDALELQAASSVKLTPEVINPVMFELGVAPHFAAELEGVSLSVQQLMAASQPALNYPVEVQLVEGVGGWQMPINNEETLADFARAGDFQIVLVAGIRLGCLNHSILTYEAIQHSGLPFYGWVANCCIPDVPMISGMVSTLKKRFAIPHLGTVAYQQAPEEVLTLNQ